jgi:molecular chaperone HtpG
VGRNKSDITPEQYDEFYKHVSHDFQAPLTHTHNRVEGRSEYTQLLYIPAKAPFDLWDRNKRGGIKLYVKRVFIMDDAEQLMPTYLRFVKGVIDSADLPLNVSREILQESRDVKVIRDGSTKRVIGMLEELANADEQEKKDKYTTFWTEFGQVLKEGIGEDATNKDRLAKLLRFASTANDSDDRMSRWSSTSPAPRKARTRSTTSRPITTWPRKTARTWKSSARRASKCCC